MKTGICHYCRTDLTWTTVHDAPIDHAGELACDDCNHDECGFGHYDAADRAACEATVKPHSAGGYGPCDA